MLSEGEHYCDEKVSTFNVQNNYRSAKHAWNRNFLSD